MCKLYYYESRTHEEIAKKFNVSCPFISKMLQEARQVGIVEILVHDDPLPTTGLEKDMEQMFNLKQVIIVWNQWL